MILPTAARYAGPGFLKRSLDEFKRQAKFGKPNGGCGVSEAHTMQLSR